MSRSGLAWYKRFPSDWLDDAAVQSSSLEARGAWAQILEILHHEDTPRITRTIPAWRRLLGADSDEHTARVLREIGENGVADVEFVAREDAPGVGSSESGARARAGAREARGHVPTCPQNVLVSSRRMEREHKMRERERLKKRAQRAKSQVSPGRPPVESESEYRVQKEVPLPDPSPRPPKPDRARHPPRPRVTRDEINAVLEAYPEHRRTTEGVVRTAIRKAKEEGLDAAAIVRGIERWKRSRSWADPRFVRNQRDWLQAQLYKADPNGRPGSDSSGRDYSGGGSIRVVNT